MTSIQRLRGLMHAVDEFARAKAAGRRISIVTAYDAWSARLVSRSNVDAILVGDSAAMVIHGHPTTLPATLSLMAMHTRAVARAAGGKFVIADLPFLSFRKGIPRGDDRRRVLVRSGAHAVKLEGVDGHEDVIRQLSARACRSWDTRADAAIGQPAGWLPRAGAEGCGRREARRAGARARATSDASAIVLECVPAALAARITSELTVPTIGIGAGAATDGQVLVLQDLWGVDGPGAAIRPPLRGRRNRADRCTQRVRQRRQGQAFPGPEESYS